MKKFIKVALVYIKRYKKYAFLNIFFNISAVIFSLFSLAMLMPILGILFNTTHKVYQLVPWTFTRKYWEVLINNLFYFPLSNLIELHSKQYALTVVSLILIVMVMMKTFCQFMANYFMTPLRNGVLKDLRNEIYSKVLRLPIGYFSETRKGDIMSRMSGDVAEIEWSIMSSLEMISRDPFTIILFVGMLVYMSPQLSLFVLILLPIGALIIGRVGKSLRKTSMKGQIKMGELMSTIEETLGGLRIIKAFNGEAKAAAKFFRQNNEYTKIANRTNRRRFLASPLSEFLGTMIVVVILFYGGNLVLNGGSQLEPESFIGYLVIFSQVINPSKALSSAFYNIQKGMASIDRINVILKAEEKIVDKETAIDINAFKDNITFNNVSFAYENEQVLKNININIKKGSTVALVGQSGSGKSTLVDLIPRFYDIVNGDILIDGTSIKDIKIKSLRGIMGNVNQEAILFNDTFYNNIAFGVESTTMEDVIAAAKVANAHDFIMATENGYETNIGDRGGKLSGGQRQRISIARAVLKNPPILILDEATSALDTESEYLVQEALVNLMKNRTSIVIAHRLSTIKHADVIYVLHEGEIVEQGKHEEIIALNGYYKKLYDLQMF